MLSSEITLSFDLSIGISEDVGLVLLLELEPAAASACVSGSVLESALESVELLEAEACM